MLVNTGGAELGVGAVVAAAVVGAGAVVVVVGNVDDAAVVATTVVVLAAISVGDGAGAIVVVPPLSPPPDPHAARPAATSAAARARLAGVSRSPIAGVAVVALLIFCRRPDDVEVAVEAHLDLATVGAAAAALLVRRFIGSIMRLSH